MEDVKCRIAKAFGCLRGPIFNNPILSIPTKRAVHRATVLSVLTYGAETWTLKAEHVRRLAMFHNRCVRTILGVTRYQQWEQRLTSKALAKRFGMVRSIPDIIMDRRLSGWDTSDVWKISDCQNKCYSENWRRKGRVMEWWRDQVSNDLQAIKLKEDWYQLSQDRKGRLAKCRKGVDEVAS